MCFSFRLLVFHAFLCRHQLCFSFRLLVFHAFLCRHQLRFSFRLLVFHAFLCRHRQIDKFKVSCFSTSTGYVLRLFMSIGLRFCAFLCRYLRFSLSILMSTDLCNYGVMFFYVVIFNPDVYSILMYILWLAKRYSAILITYFTRIIHRAWTLRIYKYAIISGRYHE